LFYENLPQIKRKILEQQFFKYKALFEKYFQEKHLVKKNQNVLKTSIPKLLFSIKKKTFFVKLKNKIVIKIFLSFILYLKYFVLQGYFKKNYSLKTSILRLK